MFTSLRASSKRLRSVRSLNPISAHRLHLRPPERVWTPGPRRNSNDQTRSPSSALLSGSEEGLRHAGQGRIRALPPERRIYAAVAREMSPCRINGAFRPTPALNWGGNARMRPSVSKKWNGVSLGGGFRVYPERCLRDY